MLWFWLFLPFLFTIFSDSFVNLCLQRNFDKCNFLGVLKIPLSKHHVTDVASLFINYFINLFSLVRISFLIIKIIYLLESCFKRTFKKKSDSFFGSLQIMHWSIDTLLGLDCENIIHKDIRPSFEIFFDFNLRKF